MPHPVLATMLILVLVILEDWYLSFYAKFHDTRCPTCLMDYCVSHAVLRVGPKALLATVSERLVPTVGCGSG